MPNWVYNNLSVTGPAEEEQGWGGTFLFHEGVGSEEDSYDIPTSHAEVVERKGYCECEAFPEGFYSDCPKVEEEVTV